MNFFSFRKRKISTQHDNENTGFLLAMWPETWLLVACWLGHYEIVKVLLERGVDFSVRDGDGRFGTSN